FEATAKDVHGLARGNKKNPGPVCSGCHQAHGVKAASLGSGIRDTCLSCHKDALKLHEVWLPNSKLHFEAISCPACHAPDAQRRVNLRLHHEVGRERTQLIEKSGVPQFVRLTKAADQTSQGLDDRALLGLLKDFTKEEDQGKIVLRGRLEVSSGVEAHQLADKSKAIADCKACHQSGAQTFQSVILTMAGPDGRPLRHGVREDVLNSAFSIDSIRGFYVLGSTRIKLLDYLMALVFLGLVGGIGAHMTARWWFRRAREKRSRELIASQTSSQKQKSADDSGGR
ncbi:MAG: cytochrome c3 family protein, partial [Lysobacterales bacterium]